MKLFDQFDTEDLYILKILMHHEENFYVTSSYLANLIGRTNRTVKKDVKRICQLLEERNVAKIISIKGKGYKIIPLNSDLYQKFFYAVQSYSEFYGNQEKIIYQRKIFILKLLLVKFQVTLNELSEKLFINNTSLIQHLSEVKQQLNSWGIDVYSSSKKVEINNYDEYDYRLLASNLSIDYFYPLDRFDMIELTESLVGSKDHYKIVRKKTLDYLRDIDYVLMENKANALPLYLCVTKKRIEKGNLVNHSSHSDLKNYKEYEIAKNLFLINHINCNNEEEILSIASLLICIRDFDITSLKEKKYLYSNILDECHILYSYIIENMREGLWNIVIDTNAFKQNKDYFISILMKIVVNMRYGNTQAIKLIHNQEATYYEFSQCAIEMARIMLYFVQKRYNQLIYGYNFLEIIYYIDYILNNICNYSKKRIALCSYLGRVVANQEKKYLLTHFRDHIESIKVFNFYEIRKEKFENYDLIINDKDIFINQYPIPCIYYNYLDENKDVYILNKISEHSVSKDLDSRLAEITRTISDVVNTNIIHFFKTLALVYAENGREEDVFNFLKIKHKIIPYDKKDEIFFIFIESSLCRKEFIDIYQVKGFGKYAFVICLKTINQIEDLKIINKMMKQIKNNEEYVKKIYKDPLKGYQELIQICTKK